MAIEREQNLIPLRGIFVDLAERSITLEGPEEPLGKLILSSGSIYFQKPSVEPPILAATADDVPASVSDREDESGSPNAEPRERQQAVALTGRIKSRPREGRPDSQGHPTAWARLAAHDEGRDDAHIYSTTFHRGAARIALNLALNAQVTVEGYPHRSNDPEGKRLDTLSVFRFLDYPKPEPGAG